MRSPQKTLQCRSYTPILDLTHLWELKKDIFQIQTIIKVCLVLPEIQMIPKSMFMFTHNQAHPDCCPSTYSTSTGCVCTTKEQVDFINKRGKNRSSDLYPGI